MAIPRSPSQQDAYDNATPDEQRAIDEAEANNDPDARARAFFAARDSRREREARANGEGENTGYDPETGRGTFRQIDPQTGEPYEHTGAGERSGGNGVFRNTNGAQRREDRRAKRREAAALQRAREDYYGANMNEANTGVMDPWADLAGNLPTREDLAGGGDLTSELGGAQGDAQGEAAQRAALLAMQQVAQGGMSAQEQAQMQAAKMDAANYERQQRDAVMQQAAMRGMQGSGTTLAAQLAAQQGGANRVSQMAMDTNAQAQQRALQAMQMQAQQGQQLRGQGFQEDATRRSAVDDFNRYNRDTRGAAAQQEFTNRGQVAQGTSAASESQRDYASNRLDTIRGEKVAEKESRRNAGKGYL